MCRTTHAHIIFISAILLPSLEHALVNTAEHYEILVILLRYSVARRLTMCLVHPRVCACVVVAIRILIQDSRHSRISTTKMTFGKFELLKVYCVFSILYMRETRILLENHYDTGIAGSKEETAQRSPSRSGVCKTDRVRGLQA